MEPTEARTIGALIVHGALLLVAVALIVIDVDRHRLPDRIVLPTLVSLLGLVILDAALFSEGATLGRSLAGMILLGGFYAVLRALSRGGVGGGDVKLAAVIGLLLGWHGWTCLILGAAAAFALGALAAVVLLLFHRAGAETRIAFGPWMIMGAAIGIAVS